MPRTAKAKPKAKPKSKAKTFKRAGAKRTMRKAA